MQMPPEPYLSQYLRYELTSYDIAKLLNVHPVTVRRSIKRPPRQILPKKSELIRLRNVFRASQAHLPAKDLQGILNVSKSTAHRIKARYSPPAHHAVPKLPVTTPKPQA